MRTLVVWLYRILLIITLLIVLATACTSDDTEAPVVDGWKQNIGHSSDYRVQPGDTIYSIAWSFATDYREIATLNQLKEPYSLRTGQSLRMSPHSKQLSQTIGQTKKEVVVSKAKTYAYSAPPVPIQAEDTTTPITPIAEQPPDSTSPINAVGSKKWLWPTAGTVLHGFSMASGENKGIDIAGHLGQPVIATQAGEVVYTGSGLPGYGNLILLKHTDNELSAYAFNKTINVKEGERVKAGQIIAKMGKNEMGKPLLHFEIRQGGKPVDPMPYLTGKK